MLGIALFALSDGCGWREVESALACVYRGG
jgi:hypothetical protein